jgi:hypothetical protein
MYPDDNGRDWTNMFFGSDPVCTWDSTKTQLTVTLGQDASLDLNHLNMNVTIQREPEEGEVCSYDTLPETLVPLKESVGQLAPTPVVSLITTSPVAHVCEDAYIVANPVSGYFNAPLDYSWRFNGTSDLPSGFRLAADNSSVTYSKGSEIDSGFLDITVDAVSVINKKGSAAASVDFVAGTDVITVTTDTLSPLVLRGTSEYEVRGRSIAYEGCEETTSSIGYTWAFQSSTDGSTP